MAFKLPSNQEVVKSLEKVEQVSSSYKDMKEIKSYIENGGGNLDGFSAAIAAASITGSALSTVASFLNAGPALHPVEK